MENEFDEIRPYTDQEAVDALARVARHPMMPIISKYLFPKYPAGRLASMLKDVTSVDEFQDKVMSEVVTAIIGKTSEGFTYTGIDNISKDKRYLFVSNHRDIVLDPALIQYALYENGLPLSEICIGNNLISSQLVEDLMRSNRMITVIRGISARELYLCSKRLSSYIRRSITTKSASVWIAQREGRTKNGLDTTEQGLLKMFDLSGEKGFVENFKELCIVPLSISYEYESCDFRKAREILMKQIEGKYVKKKNEDLHSILTGIRQMKGHIHLNFGKPLTEEEITEASKCSGNDRYQAIRHLMDARIREGYKLYKTNYMAWDLLHEDSRYLGVKYLPEDLAAFVKYTDHKLRKAERKLPKDELKKIFLEIYANPVGE